MQVTETSSEGLRREFKIVIPALEIDQRIQSRLAKLSRDVRLPGFRPGKVPLSVLKQRFGRTVMGEVLEDAVGESSRQTMSDRGLRPALQPQIEVTQFDEGTDLEFTMALEVLPDIEVPNLEALELERPVAEVDDPALDDALARLATRIPRVVPVTEPRPARRGDQVVVDVRSHPEGAPESGSVEDGRTVVIGEETFGPEVDSALVDRAVGDQVTVTVPQPGEAGAEAPPPLVYEIDIREIREQVPAAVDDELAKAYGSDSVADLREALRQQLEQEYRRASRRRVKRQLLDQLAESCRFTVPGGMVDFEFEHIWQQVQQALQSMPLDPDAAKPEEQLRSEYRAIAERRVRLGLLLAEIGRLNNIDVKADEINRVIAAEIRQFPNHAKQIIDYYKNRPEAVAALRAPILEDKVVDFILEIAKISERTVSAEELFRETEDATPEAAAAADGAPAADGRAADGKDEAQPSG